MFYGHLWYGRLRALWTNHCVNITTEVYRCFKWGIVGFILSAVCAHASQMCPRGSEFDPSDRIPTEMQHVAFVSAVKSSLITVFPSFFHTGQLQFLQHQMQQQQMAMGTAAPQVGAPQQHTASQPRSKRKRSMPQPLPKWQAQITLRTFPSNARGHEWFILCSSSASLWRQKQCPFRVFF